MYLLLLCWLLDIDIMSRGEFLGQNKCNSIPCTAQLGLPVLGYYELWTVPWGINRIVCMYVYLTNRSTVFREVIIVEWLILVYLIEEMVKTYGTKWINIAFFLKSKCYFNRIKKFGPHRFGGVYWVSSSFHSSVPLNSSPCMTIIYPYWT